MATATEVISSLNTRGVTLEPDGAGGLRVKGTSRLTERERTALKAHKGAILRALSHPTVTTAGAAVAANSAPLPTRTEPPEPEPKERLCYQCAHFDRSPYGFPIGLCQQHGNRLQHSTSQPVRFGCCHFVIRQPDDDSKTCLACCHYSLLSTMCDAVNTGCPYPAIPPCRGDRFEMKEVRS